MQGGSVGSDFARIIIGDFAGVKFIADKCRLNPALGVDGHSSIYITLNQYTTQHIRARQEGEAREGKGKLGRERIKEEGVGGKIFLFLS